MLLAITSMIQKILQGNNKGEKKALFVFDKETSNERVIFKFNLWARHYFSKYFTSRDAPFHKDIDTNNLKAYRGEIETYTNIAYRGGAKTARTKLFVAYCIANDLDKTRKYIKCLASDGVNSKQIATDVYNMLVSIKDLYPEVFRKTATKREETMGSFTTSTGIKVISDTVGTEQRGAIQEEARPDFIWFEDFENRKTLRSVVQTISIWDNMEEARTGLSKDGACVYTCNYLAESGNVHKLVLKESDKNIVDIVPIIKDGIISWERYSKDDIDYMKENDEDYEGERLCNPSATKNIYFNRETLDRQIKKEALRESAEFKIFNEFDASHRYGSGHDIAGGVGLDSSTSVFIDFETVPARVVATFKSNEIKPEAFGHEMYRQQEIYPGSIAGIENNYGAEAILVMKQKQAKLYKTQPKDNRTNTTQPTEYGWKTTSLSKPKMLSALAKAIEDGLLDLQDKDLIAELKSYTRNDLIETVKDPRLTTRHFDLLMACAIAWQMKDFAELPRVIKYEQEDLEPLRSDIGI